MRSAKLVLPDRAPPRSSTCSPISSSDSALTSAPEIGRGGGAAARSTKPPKSIAYSAFAARSNPLWSARARGAASGRGRNLSRYYLGVDGGGTNCRIRLANENLVTLGEGHGGPSNLQIQNGEPAYRSILEGTRAAFNAAGLPPSAYAQTYGCFCMAGGRSVVDRDIFQHRPWPFASVRVYDDIDAAHAGALGGEEGAVIIAGTGSAALAIVGGRRHQCGGWGFHIGDQLSGAILGRELVRRAVEATDGLVSGSPLTEAVVQH